MLDAAGRVMRSVPDAHRGSVGIECSTLRVREQRGAFAPTNA
jgi:hypothetical protein